METLYNPQTLETVLKRIEKLKPDTQAVWGKMDVAQMMEHCSRAFDFSTGKIFPKRTLLGYLLGPIFKKQYYNDKPWDKNSPTMPIYKVTDKVVFEQSRQRLVQLVTSFSLGGEAACTTHPSPFFGKLTPAQHGMGQYKHLDHHLRQFGV